MEGYIAQILFFAGNFAPRSWAFCDGSLLPISQYQALFSLIGTIYGGDGISTFALPDLRGRVAVGAGDGPGLSDYQLGQKGGAEYTTLTVNQLPTHTHQVNIQLAVSTGNGTTDEPNGNVLAGSSANIYATATSANGKLAGISATDTPTGGNQPVSIVQPYLAMNYIICLEGIYPSRS
ncbi:MAG: phage tail protein [Haliscomenobacteraceae bacterium CHB4]|nr:hypothetical protein [Saprospiraceae bacterium]MCE7926490.1 phage tail protein [Haliscomenobacteraceae bacterium CHB4]